MKIGIIGIYFGTLPNYFSLWLKSCETNKEIDFLIFTDIDKPTELLPDNVRWIPYTLEMMRKKATELLGFEAALNSPYKCCDFRPFYGELFSEYITEYDYWGHCDFDLIWGDLTEFFCSYKLENYDKFLPLGHLSLYKNSRDNNRRYMLEGSRCGDYLQAFSQRRHLSFDEEGGAGSIFLKHNLPYFTERIFADISDSYKRFRCARKDKNYRYQVFFWRNGKVYRAFYENNAVYEEEFIYIHFQKRGFLPMTDECVICDCFFITKYGFFSNPKGYATLEDMKKYNPFFSWTYEYLERKGVYARRKLTKVKERVCSVIRNQMVNHE